VSIAARGAVRGAERAWSRAIGVVTVNSSRSAVLATLAVTAALLAGCSPPTAQSAPVAPGGGDQDQGPVNPQGDPGPVLIVPGYGGEAGALIPLAEKIEALGREAEIVDLPDQAKGDLAGQAKRVAQVANDMAGDGGTVDVIGYSAGGVVARLWVRDYGGAKLARRVVTLGSPHHGTTVARAAASFAPDQCPQACHQLVPESELLASLNSGDETPAGPLWMSIWTADDEVIGPADSSKLEGAVNVDIRTACSTQAKISHGRLPTEATVVGLVLRSIGEARPKDVGADDCAALREKGA
jgi:triacylglycerol lipase